MQLNTTSKTDSEVVDFKGNPCKSSPWRLSVAPMMDWTDRHCRYLHRLITRHTRLYTEMVTTGAIRHGDQPRHLDFSPQEHPIALQLGGSEPQELAYATTQARRWGYDEVNLNCGCPSERVQRGAFGACLMREAALVAQCVSAMVEAAQPSQAGQAAMPITVKHRIGIDKEESYGFVRDFVGTVAEAGCEVFIVHARNAWLKGLSPKENREIPPLRYEMVYQLKREFPQLTVVLNGGVSTDAQIAEHLQHLDGVMVGREAYHNPWVMADWDARFWGDTSASPTERADIERQMVRYMEQLVAQGLPWSHAARHMLGLYNGIKGARHWRQVWSDHQRKADPPSAVWQAAKGPQAP
jgi:tRNA-dihydrouridine synthase A